MMVPDYPVKRLYPHPPDVNVALDYMPEGDENDSQNMFLLTFTDLGAVGTASQIRRRISFIEEELMRVSDVLREASGE